MSLKETDFPSIIKKLKDFSDLYKNPGLIEKIVHEIYKNYRYIPLYPGIIYETLVKMVKELSPDELQINDWISFEIDGKKYSGYVSSIEGDKVQIKNITKTEFLDKMEIGKSKIAKLIKINEAQLKEDWPMLIYKENHNSR